MHLELASLQPAIWVGSAEPAPGCPAAAAAGPVQRPLAVPGYAGAAPGCGEACQTALKCTAGLPPYLPTGRSAKVEGQSPSAPTGRTLQALLSGELRTWTQGFLTMHQLLVHC